MENKELRKLVIFYSLEGNTRYIAENINKITGAQLLELKPKKDIRSKGFMKYVWGGSQVIMGKKPELMLIDKNLEDYDMFFFGTPVWAGNYTPVINTFLHEYKITGKKLAFFCCHGGGGNSRTFKNFREKLYGNEILGELEFKDPLKNDREKAVIRLQEWLKRIL